MVWNTELTIWLNFSSVRNSFCTLIYVARCFARQPGRQKRTWRGLSAVHAIASPLSCSNSHNHERDVLPLSGRPN